MLKNKFFLALAILILAALVLSACGTGTSTSASTAVPLATQAPANVISTVQPNTAPTAAYLTINAEQQATWVRNFNPFSPDARLQAAQGTIYEPMMIFNKTTGELIPWLATGYNWNADNTQLTFQLRQNVQWSDGQPFTAKDVTFTFDLLKNHPELLNNLGSILTDNIDGWSAPDDYTVQFKFKVVLTPALYLLANQLIVPEHIWKDIQDPSTFTNDTPVGTGPFTEVTTFQDQIYVIEKNPHYWQTGKPYFQGLRFPAYPGNDQANLALANGELDWAGNFVPDIQHTFVQKDPQNFHYYFASGDPILLYINPAIKPFDNPDVRKAISMGIDRKMVVNVAEYDYIPPLDATGLSDEFKTWKNPDAVAAGTWTNYDPTAANAMLDKAGLKRGSDGIRIGPDGKPMKYSLLSPNGWTDWNSACQIIAQNMKDLGIDITLDTPEQNTWQEELFPGKFQWSLGWADGGATPYDFYRGQMSKATILPVGTDANDNWNRYDDPQADQLLAQFGQTSDPTQQKSIINQLQTLFVNDAPALPLFPGPDWYEYVTTRFTGFPTQDNPYAPGPPFNTPVFAPNSLLVLVNLKPK